MLRYKATLQGHAHKVNAEFRIPEEIVKKLRIQLLFVGPGTKPSREQDQAFRRLASYVGKEYMAELAVNFKCFFCRLPATTFFSNISPLSHPSGPIVYDSATALCRHGGQCDLKARELGVSASNHEYGVEGLRGKPDVGTAKLRKRLYPGGAPPQLYQQRYFWVAIGIAVAIFVALIVWVASTLPTFDGGDGYVPL